MALNPPISQQGMPFRVDGEAFILHREDMELEVKIPNLGKYTAKGKIFLTTARIVFVSKNFVKDTFKSFDIPVAFLHHEKFQQPIFGSNYLEGKVEPLHNLLPGTTQFKLWFLAGGCSMFLKVLSALLQQVRQRRGQGQMGPDPRWVDHISQTQAQGYTDSSDPSVVYIQQPQNQWTGNVNIKLDIIRVNSSAPGPQNQPQQGYVVGQPVQQQQPYFSSGQNQQQPPPQQYQPPPQQYQPPPQQYQPPPQQYQPPPQQYQPPPQQYQQAPQQYQPPPDQYQPPPQQYQQPPQYQANTYQAQLSQQPPQQPDQGQYNYPSLQESVVQPQAQQQPLLNQPQPNNQPQPQPEPNRPNVAYYYGFWGPQLQSNQHNNNQL